MIRILLADNQPLTSTGIQSVLAVYDHIQIVGSASDIYEIKDYPGGWDVLLIDPFHSDQITLDDLKQLDDLSHVVIITANVNKEEIDATTAIGISNYLSKECSPYEILEAIIASADGKEYFCKKINQVLEKTDDAVEIPSELPALSARELEIIQLVADGKTNREIAEMLFLSIHTVKTHRKNIIKKLGFNFKKASGLLQLLSK